MGNEDFWKTGEDSSEDLDLDQLNFYMEPPVFEDPEEDPFGQEDQQSTDPKPDGENMDWELDRLKALLGDAPEKEAPKPAEPDLPPLEQKQEKKPLKLFQHPAPELEQARQASAEKKRREKKPREKKPPVDDGLTPAERRMKYVALGFAAFALLTVIAAIITVAVFYFRAGL